MPRTDRHPRRSRAAPEGWVQVSAAPLSVPALFPYFVLRTSYFVLPLYPRPEPADDFPGNGADRGGHLAGCDLLVSLPPDDHHLVAGGDLETGDVRDQHVHTDGADDRHTASAHEHRRTAAHARVQPVGVAGRNDCDRARAVGPPQQTVTRRSE